jgi:hypothetical protein
MPNLGGFEVVGELTVAVLNQVLRGAWDNGIIPHSVDIPAGTPFGPFQAADGVANFPRAGVALVMDPPVNGVRVTLAAEVQVEVANPPIPSARLFELAADVTARVPLGVLPGTIKVAAMLDGIPRSSVSAAVTSGNPVPALTLTAVEEYVHARYRDGTIPDHFSRNGVAFGIYTADAWLDVYDDPALPTHRIAVGAPAAGRVKLRIPVHLKLSGVKAAGSPVPTSPMGVVAKLALTCDLVEAPGSITARLATAAVEVEDFAPAPTSDAAGSYDGEGANYTLNDGFSGGLLGTLLQEELRARGRQVAGAVGDITVAVPTLAQIETFIADRAHEAITGRGNIGLWTPAPPPDSGVFVENVRPLALAEACAFCLNDPGGADTGVIVDFIPPGRTCAIAISAAKVLEIIDEQIHRPEDEGGFGPGFPPHTFPDVDGHEARLNSLSISLATGSLHVQGDVTVVDAIADSIDVDASFEAEVGLEWVDAPGGGQMVRPFTISDDVDLSLLAWILSFLLGFITFGLVGGIIAVVVVHVVEGIAERVGGAVIRDEVTGQVQGIGAWPQQLEGIGEVTSRFENPVGIDPQGIVFADAYQVTATFASVPDALARANGPYQVPEGAEVEFIGGPARPHTTYRWDFGDGSGAAGAQATHRYADNGLYVAKLTTTVNREGGVVTRHFAAVRVVNVPAIVDAGPPLTLDEGEAREFTATFTDPGWPDTHVALFDFGDDSAPVEGTLAETHDAPLGRGTARASHAYCDDGAYTVTVRVRDDDGGMGVSTLHATVRNVAPRVEAGDDVFAYPCTPLTLVALFRDPGWCDTHTATWDFGDCSAPVPASVRERNEPPEGCGIAAATHRYDCCGSFHAVCRVWDDDGASGEDRLLVRVVDVENGGFESGFHSHPEGVVGNGWEPYVVSAAGGKPGGAFAAEELVVHGGRRSQRIDAAGGARAGVWQRVGANPGWDYQVSAWCHREPSGGTCRLGIDPAGGNDPRAPEIVWLAADGHGWRLLAVRATAGARAVTLFLEHQGGEREGRAWWDDVELLPYPCPLGEAPPCAPDRERTCVGWRGEGTPRQLGPTHVQEGFTFASPTAEPLRVVTWGAPAGAGKLVIPARGLYVGLPFAAAAVHARVSSASRTPVAMEALDAAGASLGHVLSSAGSPGVETLETRAAGIVRLRFAANEGLLVELCVERGKAGGGRTR